MANNIEIKKKGKHRLIFANCLCSVFSESLLVVLLETVGIISVCWNFFHNIIFVDYFCRLLSLVISTLLTLGSE
jgi:hypothetical protein